MEGFNVKDKSLLENKEFLQGLMERMMLVHTFEERAFWLFGQGLVHGTMHLSIGEEATGVGTSAALTKDDYMLATHLSLIHILIFWWMARSSPAMHFTSTEDAGIITVH